MELLFANCVKEIPTATAARQKLEPVAPNLQMKQFPIIQRSYSPTMPSTMQYMAPKIGSGMEAKNAPNFPVRVPGDTIKYDNELQGKA